MTPAAHNGPAKTSDPNRRELRGLEESDRAQMAAKTLIRGDNIVSRGRTSRDRYEPDAQIDGDFGRISIGGARR